MARSVQRRTRRCDGRASAKQFREPRLVATLPAIGVTYRGGKGIGLVVVLIAAVLGAVVGELAGWLASLAVVTSVLVGWVAWAVRLLRLAVWGGGPPPGGGGTAGVREPRRPRPRPPAGGMALAVPVEPPDEAAAFA